MEKKVHAKRGIFLGSDPLDWEVPGASAGFLEFSGAGLAHLERAIERAEKRMSLLRARLLEHHEAGDAEGGAGGGQLCGLGSIVASLNGSLSRVLRLAQRRGDAARSDSEPYRAQGVSFAMNTDLGARAMSGRRSRRW